jgi:hypothetical protein
MSRDGSHSNDVYGGVEMKGYSVRSRVPTERGLNYAKELAEKELTKVLRGWRNEIENVKSLLADEMNSSTLATCQKMREDEQTNSDLRKIS